MKVISVSSIFLGVLGIVAATPASAGLITDGDFSSFSFNATGTATVTRESTGGNPGARLNVTTFSGDTVHGTAIKTDFITTENLSGSSFVLSLDVLSGPGSFGEGQGISLLVEQGGSIYGRNVGKTFYPRNFDTLSFSGTFDASSFSLLIGSGSANPDFSGGVATRFGFSARNTRSGTLTQYYDNFRLESSAIDASTVPEPTSMALWGLGSLGIGVIARRRKRKQTDNAA